MAGTLCVMHFLCPRTVHGSSGQVPHGQQDPHPLALSHQQAWCHCKEQNLGFKFQLCICGLDMETPGYSLPAWQVPGLPILVLRAWVPGVVTLLLMKSVPCPGSK